MADQLSRAPAFDPRDAPPANARVALALVPHHGALALRLDPGDQDALEAARACLGADLPLAPGWSESADGAVLWQAFDEWLILVADGREGDLAGRLHKALDGKRFAVTDVSDQYAGIEVIGSASRELLAKGCALDLHPRGFGGRACAVAGLARVRVTLRLTGEPPVFHVIVERSYAQYLWDWLADAAREIA